MGHAENTHMGKRKLGVAGPTVLIALGLAFLAANFDFLDDLGTYWPVIVIVAGLGMLIDRIRR